MTARPRFSSFADVEAYLDKLGLFHMDLSLGRMKRALAKAKRPPCPVVQVVGTNGKGSTSAFLQSLAMAHGFRAGLYTSPHFVSPAERIRLNEKELPRAAWPDLAERALAAEPDLTYFELLTVMAWMAFGDTEPDLLIFEAGLGGRHDATTALPAHMVCFTPIALDHQAVLGPDLASIAADKADAMRPGLFAAVSAPQKPEAAAALQGKARALRLPLRLLEPDAPDILPERTPLGLRGPHQSTNARTALTAWSVLAEGMGWQNNENAIRRGLGQAFIPGRLQDVRLATPRGETDFVLDGAHNPHGMSALREAMRDRPPAAVIFSCLRDKNPEALAALVRDIARGAPVLAPTIAGNERACPGTELAALLGRFGAEAFPASDLAAALDSLDKFALSGPVLVCGSLYLLGEFFTLFPRALQPEREPIVACALR